MEHNYLADYCRKEVIELHQFFEDWFLARLPDNAESMKRLESALSMDFEMITPSGDIVTRGPLLESIEGMNGHFQSKGRPGAIWIRNIEIRLLDGDYCLMRYEEWQGSRGRDAANNKGRLSSALFQYSGEAPNFVKWVHLHEVWL